MEATARTVAAWVIVVAVALLILKFVVGAVIGLLYSVLIIAVIGVALMWALRHI